MKNQSLRHLWPGILLLSLSACDSGTGSASRSALAGPVGISGQILDDEGTPMQASQIQASDRDGQAIGTVPVDSEGHFSLQVPAGASYPLVLTAAVSGLDTPLKAVIREAGVTEQDISPMTTIVVDTALSLGGLTEANLTKAAGAAISQRKKSGGTGSSTGFKGDPTKQYGGWH